jgi:hypothetical protein
MAARVEAFDEAHLQSLVSSLGKKQDTNDGEQAGQRGKVPYVRDPQCHGWENHFKKTKKTPPKNLTFFSHRRNAARPAAVPAARHDARAPGDDAAARVEHRGEGLAAAHSHLPQRD